MPEIEPGPLQLSQSKDGELVKKYSEKPNYLVFVYRNLDINKWGQIGWLNEGRKMEIWDLGFVWNGPNFVCAPVELLPGKKDSYVQWIEISGTKILKNMVFKLE